MESDTKKVVVVSVEHVVDRAVSPGMCEAWYEEQDRSYSIHGVYCEAAFDADTLDNIAATVGQELLGVFRCRYDVLQEDSINQETETIYGYSPFTGGYIRLEVSSLDSGWRYTANVTATIEEVVQPNESDTK